MSLSAIRDSSELASFRVNFRQFLKDQVVPAHSTVFRSDGFPREVWRAAGAAGFLGLDVPRELGGRGIDDYRYSAVVAQEIVAAGLNGFAITLQNDIVIPYISAIANHEQRKRWLPALCAGESVSAIAMTEPEAGSDLARLSLTARKVNGGYRLNGEKFFISNGLTQNFLLLVARTAEGPMGLSLFIVEDAANAVGRTPVTKLGLRAQDTARLAFDDHFVPDGALLGSPGRAAGYLMRMLPKERLAIAVRADAGTRKSLMLTQDHVRTRQVRGSTLGSLQGIRFAVADMMAELQANEALTALAVDRLNQGRLSEADAAAAKLRSSETFRAVTDRCLHLFGAHGYLAQSEISELFLDARGITLQGGSSEIMREIIASAARL
ncbi:acyl-CoA dehydrogenase family protein [Streptomyces sp. NPDC006864]|uniref:acyl-CoA dehydrogenase family protein n=1 Tax=Streptomyces sp. NPDC006864 TaxID=3154780 RepID=UPI003453F7DC